MKIIHIIPSFYTGGGEKFTVDLSNELSKNHEVIVCSLYDINARMFLHKQLNPKIKLVTLSKSPGIDPILTKKIYDLIKKESPDVVHTHLVSIVYSLPAILFLKLKFVHTVHNIAEKEARGKLGKIIRQFLFKKKVIPISISPEVQKSVNKLYKIKNSPIVINGVSLKKKSDQFEEVKTELEKLKPSKNSKVFLNVGRITDQKNQKLLIQSFKRLEKLNKDVVLLIIGEPGNQESTLFQKLNEIKSQNIHFLGKRENVQDYYLQSNFFCLSSHYEGLPLSLLESMGYGMVSICTPVGGIPDVVPNESYGFLSVGTSEDDYYNSLVKAIELPNKSINEISHLCKLKFYEKFHISITSNSYLKIYN